MTDKKKSPAPVAAGRGFKSKRELRRHYRTTPGCLVKCGPVFNSRIFGDSSGEIRSDIFRFQEPADGIDLYTIRAGFSAKNIPSRVNLIPFFVRAMKVAMPELAQTFPSDFKIIPNDDIHFLKSGFLRCWYVFFNETPIGGAFGDWNERDQVLYIWFENESPSQWVWQQMIDRVKCAIIEEEKRPYKNAGGRHRANRK